MDWGLDGFGDGVGVGGYELDDVVGGRGIF